MGGFSGSPVFVQFYIPSTQKSDWPPIWHQMASYSEKDIDQLGALETITHWWGMFGGACSSLMLRSQGSVQCFATWT